MKAPEARTAKERFGHPLAWVAIAFLAGVALSLCSRRLSYPYFVDEIWVVRGVLDGERDITPPLLYALLRLLRGIVQTDAEWLMRVPSLLAVALGAILLPAWATLRRWSACETAAAWLTGGLLALSSPVFFYGGMVKAYALEALFSVWMIAMLVEGAPSPPRRAYWIAYLAVSGVFLVATYPAVFVVAGFCAAFAWRWIFGRRRPVAEGRAFLGVHLLLAALFLCAYAFRLRYQISAGTANDPAGLNLYWTKAFWDGSWGFIERQTLQFFGHQFNLVRGAWAVVGLHILAWAGGKIVRRQWEALDVLVFVVAPIGLVLLASRFRLYPYGEVRLMLFTAPLVFGLFAHAVAGNLRRRSWPRVLVAVLTGGFLAVFAFQGMIRDPYATGHMNFVDDRPLHALLRGNAASGEVPVFAGDSAWAGLNWYLEPGGADIRPLASAATTSWSCAWFVVDERGRGEWEFYRELQDRMGLDETTRYSPRPGSHAIRVRKTGETP